MKATVLLLFVCFVIGLAAEATINVTYTGFTTEQQAAFEAGVALWEPILNSDVPIKINARFQVLTNFALVTIPNMNRNFTGAPLANVWYPTALANAITGSEINPGEADVDYFINSNDSYYYGLDGNCPPTSIDFVSEVFKSIPYGLGYMTSFYIQNGYGSYGMLNPSALGLTTSFPWEAMQSQPAIYDTYVCNDDGQLLTNTALFTNPSPGLAAQLTGGNLLYNGEVAMGYNHSEQPVLYASAFNLARTARLNTVTYQGSENYSGCPYGSYGDVLRYPAPIVMGMLQDMGWELSMSSLRTPPANLVANVVGNDVQLNWAIPATEYEILNYLVFRDNALLFESEEETYLDADLMPGTYSYAVRARYNFGISGLSDPISAEITTAADDNTHAPSLDMILHTYPNPFSGRVEISYKLDTPQDLTLNICDTKGRQVYNQNIGITASGDHSTVWDIAAQKDTLPNGIYFVKLSSRSQTAISKVLLLK